MLHVWLIPVVFLLVVLLAAFYWLICCTGAGNGVRKEGRCVFDHDSDDQIPAPSKYWVIVKPGAE